ncbi:hypothetical protein C8N36_105185 [Pelagimonas varians]|uniref:Uncharacterized protein n=1 Tax=Pelagimonas varians TaxID=696760 RepID=A0A238K9V0_9RHOB|nr:hypothetical protein C8N36_105185 [Pelagimonas varians]SMX39690.1 hypothetical protein PEV8663_01825 [Pelagimonas varians]
MTHRTLTLTLPKHIWSALNQGDCPVEDAIAMAVQAYCSSGAVIATAPQSHSAVPALSDDLERAKSWPELQGRLKLAGYLLRHGQNGLVICDARTRQRVCSLSQTGHTETELASRFGRAFPASGLRWDIDNQLETGQTKEVTTLHREQTLRTVPRQG